MSRRSAATFRCLPRRRWRTARCRASRLALRSAASRSRTSSRSRLRTRAARTSSSAVTATSPASTRTLTHASRSTSTVPLANLATRTGSSWTRTLFPSCPMAPMRLAAHRSLRACLAGGRRRLGAVGRRLSAPRPRYANLPAPRRLTPPRTGARPRHARLSLPRAALRTPGGRSPKSRRSRRPRAVPETRCVLLHPTRLPRRPSTRSVACHLPRPLPLPARRAPLRVPCLCVTTRLSALTMRRPGELR